MDEPDERMHRRQCYAPSTSRQRIGHHAPVQLPFEEFAGREIICTLNQQDESDEPIEVTGSAEGSEE